MRTFLAVAQELNFGRAAQILHLAQPAVSQQIIQLEKSLSVNLFERTTRSVRLTLAGEAFLGPCRAAVEAADAAARAARSGGAGDAGMVRLGFSGSFANELVSRLTREVRQAFPQIEVFIAASANSETVLNHLATDRLDIGILAATHHHPEVDSRLISAYQLGVLMASDHQFSTREDVTLSELRHEPFILTNSASGFTLRELTLQVCLNAGFYPQVAQEAMDSYTVFALVAGGLGVTLAPESARFVVPSGVVYVPLTDVHERLFSVLAWPAKRQFPALRTVLRVAERVLPTPEDNEPQHTP